METCWSACVSLALSARFWEWLLLGPLALGRLSPTAFTFLFPPAQLKPLETAGRIGLILFLFLMGAELDLAALRRNTGAAFAITFGSLYLPFAFGASLAPELRIHFGFADTRPIVFLIFVGVAMSITALPVLARIIQDRKRSTRPVDASVAATSLLSAAANDLLAWALLAVALALTRRSGASTHVTLHLVLLIVFVAGMLFVVRPLARLMLTEGVATWALVIASIPFAILSGQISEALGVHAFFGAFLAGLCFPLRHNAWLANLLARSLKQQLIVDLRCPLVETAELHALHAVRIGHLAAHMHCNLSRRLRRISIDPRRDRRECNLLRTMLLREFQRAPIATGQLLRLRRVPPPSTPAPPHETPTSPEDEIPESPWHHPSRIHAERGTPSAAPAPQHDGSLHPRRPRPAANCWPHSQSHRRAVA